VEWKPAVSDYILLIKMRTGRNIRFVLDSGPFAPLCENMTSSTKPEVHNLLHCRQRRTEPRPEVTCAVETLVKVGRAVLIYARADRQTNKQTHRQAESSTSHLYRGRRNDAFTGLCVVMILNNE